MNTGPRLCHWQGWLLISLVLAGCGAPGTPTKATSEKDSEAIPATQTLLPQTAQGFAKTFLQELSVGEVTPDQLSPAFRKIVAPPVPGFDRDEKLGYSDSDLENWLKTMKGSSYTIEQTLDYPPDQAFRGRVQGGDAKWFGLVVSKAKAGSWQVDWFHRTRASSNPSPPTGDDAAMFAARALLELLIDGNYRHAEAWMTDAMKEKIGGSPSSTDTAKGLSFDRAWLHTQLRKRLRDVRGYTLTGTGNQLKATLTGPKRQPSVSLSVTDRKVNQWLD